MLGVSVGHFNQQQ